MKSLEQYYEAHALEIYRYIYFMCYNHNLAEDVLQETFYRTFHHLENNQNMELRPWLYKVARNVMVDVIRKENKSVAHKSEFFDQQTANTDPETKLLINERYKEVIFSVNSLPENQKQALILSSFHNLSYEEVASILNLTTSSVKSLIFRARTNLRKGAKS